jgi:hypothetical protein
VPAPLIQVLSILVGGGLIRLFFWEWWDLSFTPLLFIFARRNKMKEKEKDKQAKETISVIIDDLENLDIPEETRQKMNVEAFRIIDEELDKIINSLVYQHGKINVNI